MDIEVRPCASVEELRDALNAISHYFGQENQLEDAERFAELVRRRAHACGVRGRPRRRRRGRVHLRHVGARRAAGARRRRHGRRRAADASPARHPHRADAGAARGLPRARRARRLPLGLGGDDLRPVRLRPRLADRRDQARRATARASRTPFEPRGTVRLVDLGRGGAHVPAALRRGARAAARHVLAAARSGGRPAGSSTIRRAGRAAR